MFTVLHCTFEYSAGRQYSQSKTHRMGAFRVARAKGHCCVQQRVGRAEVRLGASCLKDRSGENARLLLSSLQYYMNTCCQ